jgi:hypothetical protein
MEMNVAKNNENLMVAIPHKIKLKIKNLGKATTSCYGIKKGRIKTKK